VASSACTPIIDRCECTHTYIFTYVYLYISIFVFIYILIQYADTYTYGVAMISRLLKNSGGFCRISSLS